MMYAVATILACSVLNRMRGDDTWMQKLGLKGRALFYIAPMVGVVSLLTNSLFMSIAIALSYMFWAIPPWGRWFDMNRLDDTPRKDPSWYEAIIDSASGGRDWLAMLMRMSILVPLFLVISATSCNDIPAIISLPMSAILVACYEAGWRLYPKQPILIAELLSGAVWGVAILVI